MSNSGTFAPRDLPPCFLHPKHSHQPNREEFEKAGPRPMDKRESLCPGHRETIIHLAGSGNARRFIVEVILESGSCYIESPCTFTPAMGMDVLDGHLAYDAEEWLLVQCLRVLPRRLPYIYGSEDRLSADNYIKRVWNIRLSHNAAYEFDRQTAAAEQGTASIIKEEEFAVGKPVKKWWLFWQK